MVQDRLQFRHGLPNMADRLLPLALAMCRQVETQHLFAACHRSAGKPHDDVIFLAGMIAMHGQDQAG